VSSLLSSRDASGPSRQKKSQTYDAWISSNLHIRTKGGELLTLSPNAIQTDLNLRYDAMKEEFGQTLLIVLKARQHGVSTWMQSRMFERCARNPNIQGLVLAHDAEGSNWLFGMSQLYQRMLPTDIPTDYSSRKEIVFSHPLLSSISVQVAHEFAGSSRTVQILHISELAKWKNPETTMLSLRQAGQAADTVVESTANGQTGQGRYFYEMWQTAIRGDSEFQPVFYGWQDNPDYSLGDDDPRIERLMESALTDEENAIQDAYDLTVGQLAWRRWAIRNLCGGKVDNFRQEYPINDSEAFLRVEGRRVFDIGACRLGRLRADTAPESRTGSLRWTIPPRVDDAGFCVNRESLAVEWIDDENGYISLYEPLPEDTDFTARRYFIAADVAQGIEGGDSSHGVLLDRRSRRVIAVWHGHIDPSVFGEELAKMVIWTSRGQNKTICCPEVNNMGDATLTRLFSIVGAANVWRQEDHAPGAPYSDRLARRYGFYTSGGTKERAVQCLVDVIRESMWFDPDIDFWGEAISVVREANGVAALNGQDRTAARCILAFIDRYGQTAALEHIYVKTEPDDSFAMTKKRMHGKRNKGRRKMGLSSRKAVMR